MADSITGIVTEPLEFDDFSGGMTDYYLGAPLNRYQKADNLLITRYVRRDGAIVGKLYTRPGSELYDSTYDQIPAGAQRIGTLKYFQSQLFIHSARKFYYISSGWTTLQGPSSNDVFPSGVDTTTQVSTAVWNDHMLVTSSDLTQRVQKIYKDGSNVWQLRTAGMPPLASSPTVTAGTVGTTTSYLYRYLYYYTYTVGTVTYVDRGPTTEVAYTAATAIAAGAGNTASHTTIPALANAATHNYDTSSSSLKVEIYRTTDGGSNFFKVGSVNNGTTTYSDTTADAALQLNEPLYTEGGIPENTAPPLCKVVHVLEDRAFYGHCSVGGQVLKNRVYQAIPGDIDSVPDTFFIDLTDTVVGISSVKSNPVVACSSKIFRLDGGIDEIGQGFLVSAVISDTAGIVSAQSMVQTLDGVFWAGNDGFYYTDGFQVIRISKSLDQTYQSLISTAERMRRLVGKYDSKKNRVYWTAQYDSSAIECDVCFVLDLNWGISDDMPFTTLSGSENFKPTAIEFIGQYFIRADSRGYTFIHRDTLYVDPKINAAVASSTWTSATIILDFKSTATDFGTNFYRKWVSRVGLVGRNETNLSLQINSINDAGRSTKSLSPIRFRGNVTWGDPDVYWGDPDIVWNYQGIIDEVRRFPAGGLRCTYKQIQLTNAKVAIVSSDILGTATVDSAAKTVTLDDTVSFDWPTLSIDYYIAFDLDSYVQEFLITARTADVLTFSDAGGLSVAGSRDWVIRGYPKNEVMNLMSFVLHYAIFGKTQEQFRNTGTGEVGAND